MPRVEYGLCIDVLVHFLIIWVHSVHLLLLSWSLQCASLVVGCVYSCRSSDCVGSLWGIEVVYVRQSPELLRRLLRSEIALGFGHELESAHDTRVKQCPRS